MEVELDIVDDIIKPFPRQLEFMKAVFNKRFVLYGGAMGGGKSYILRWIAILFLMRLSARGINNAEVGLFSETYPALKDRHLDKAHAEYPEWMGRWRDTDFILHHDGGIVKFRNLDNVDKYRSAEFAMIAVDELTKNKPEVFNILRTRLRWPGVTHTPFVAASNPGGPMHAFCKQVWMDRKLPEELERSYSIDDFHYVPSTSKDNPHLDPSYYESLDSLPEQMRRAYLDGDWSVFAGMFFPMLSRKKHLVKPFEIPPEWPMIAGLDPGWSSPCSFGVYAIDLEGCVYRVGGYYEKNRSASQHAQAIQEFIGHDLREWTGGRSPYVICAGMDAWARKDRNAILSNESRWVDIFLDHGLPLLEAVTDRVPGWYHVKNLLEEDNLMFFNNGLNEPLLQEMESVMHDENRTEDLQGRGSDSSVIDHAMDELRYALMTAHRGSIATPDTSWKRPTDYRPSSYKKPREYHVIQPYSKDWRLL